MSSSSSTRGGGSPSSGRSSSGRGGRGRGRGGGGGRGPGNQSGRPAPSKFTGNCADLTGSIFDCSDNKQADVFLHTVKRISEYVGKTYKHGGDMVSSFIAKARINVPIPVAPVYADPTTPTAEELTLTLIYRGKITTYLKRDANLDDNIQKAYSLILGQCSDLLQAKLKQQQDWATINDSQDSIRLLNLIRLITFRFEDQKFLPHALYQAKAALYAFRQRDQRNEEYYERFQNLVDVATAYAGQLYDHTIVLICSDKLHPGIDHETLTDEQREACHVAASDLYLATMFMNQSDPRRFGKLMEDLENNYTRGNDDYPITLIKAYHLINEFKHYVPKAVSSDSSNVAFTQKSTSKDAKQEAWKATADCHHCGAIGHIRPECPNSDDGKPDVKPRKQEKAAAPISILKDKASEKKTKKKATFAQSSGSDTETEDESQMLNVGFVNDDGSMFNFTFVNPSTSSPRIDLKNMILLDNQSTVDLFCNRELVASVWDTDESMTVHGNGGNLTTKQKAHVSNYGDVWFHPDAITNILALKNVKKQFRVTYDSAGDGIFVVHKPNGVNVLFTAHAGGLHYHDTRKRQLTMVSTVTGESEGFSKQQLAQAKAARDFQGKVGHPSTTDLKNIIRLNLISNCPVTTEDLDRAEKLYGPSLPWLKGKTT